MPAVPEGNPVKVGVTVATPTAPVSGTMVQQWMCAAVFGASRPPNVVSICSVWATSSHVTSAVPVPGEALGVASAAPERTAKNEIGTA